MAHELIHALRSLLGLRNKNPVIEQKETIGPTVPREGRLPTENDIRFENQYPPRVYEELR